MARLAYCARYGKQQLSELRALTLTELREFEYELGEIVRAENGPKPE